MPMWTSFSLYEVFISENLLEDGYEQVEEQDVSYDEVPSQQKGNHPVEGTTVIPH